MNLTSTSPFFPKNKKKKKTKTPPLVHLTEKLTENVQKRKNRTKYDYELNSLGMHIDLHLTPNNFNTPLYGKPKEENV